MEKSATDASQVPQKVPGPDCRKSIETIRTALFRNVFLLEASLYKTSWLCAVQ